MKKISKVMLIIVMMFMVIPVFAKEGITIENIQGATLNEKVTLNATDAIDVSFNDLKQNATYKLTLKNDTEESFFVTDLLVEGASEEFLEIVLKEESTNVELIPGKETEVEVIVKTLDITQAGRNFNDTVRLKLVLGDVVKNPETSNNYLVYILLIGTHLITISTMFTKLDKKKKLSIFVIGALILGTTIVYATDEDVVELEGKVSYTSQNLMKESGTQVDGYQVNYANSSDIWKYADQIKNIIISDDKTKPTEYEYRYDLTSNNSKKIYGYIVENGSEKTPYDLYIVANGIIYAPENATGLFSFPNVETINGLEFIEFEETKNMTGMFLGNEKLQNANVKSIDMSNATNTSYMFKGCYKLDVKSSDFDTSKVTNKNYMFDLSLTDVLKQNAKSDKDVNFALAPETGTYIVESTKNDTNPIYYYRGENTKNNVIFANTCWKMVRTTETGGTKLIYNGTPKATTSYSKIERAKYVVDYNSTNPFNYNSSTSVWTSSNKNHNSNGSIKFHVSTSANYILNYTVSSEKNYDKAFFYVDDQLVKTVSGSETSTIALGYLTSSNQITVKYTKDYSVNSGSDNVSFYLTTGTDQTKYTCTSTGTATQIATSKYNEQYNSPAYVGYMYGDVYTINKINMAEDILYVYAKNVQWNGEKYILTDTIESSNWKDDRETLSNGYHYSCLEGSSCTTVNYIYNFSDEGYAYYMKLDNGKKLEDAMNLSTNNQNDSTIKQVIDSWYSSKLKDYTSKLEDTIWCNDRTIKSGALLSSNESGMEISYYAGYYRNESEFKPSIKCSNKNDSFTVSDKNGNGKLTYPVGLLTADEYTMAGNGRQGYSTSTYLYTGQDQWSMTPSQIAKSSAVEYNNRGARVSGNGVHSEKAVRPVISLKNTNYILKGTGTTTDPYIVE